MMDKGLLRLIKKTGIYAMMYVVLAIFIINNVNDIGMSMSFLLVAVPLMILMYRVVNNKNLLFEATVVLFFLLFFIVAPVCQLKTGMLPNTFLINKDIVLKANIYTFIFLMVYIGTRFYYIDNKNIKKFVNMELKNYNIIKKIYFVVFGLVVIFTIKSLISSILFNSTPEIDNVMAYLIKSKYIFMFPLFLLSYEIYKLNSKKDKLDRKKIVLLILLFVLCLLVKNPFTESRNGLGPIYLSIFIYIFFNTKITAVSYLLIMIISLVVFFPFLSIFTHGGVGITELGLNNLFNGYAGNVASEFTTLNYDAWSNFMATIEYTQNNGFALGIQLLGSILFFIPRGIWPTKPISTGQIVGNYLMDNYTMWFNNLSNPFISEGYINFGIFGIIIFAIILGLFSKLIYEWLNSKTYLRYAGIYISIYLLFFLRGDLMSSFAYGVAFILTVYITPIFLDKVISKITSN